jgi:hypothetical protein
MVDDTHVAINPAEEIEASGGRQGEDSVLSAYHPGSNITTSQFCTTCNDVTGIMMESSFSVTNTIERQQHDQGGIIFQSRFLDVRVSRISPCPGKNGNRTISETQGCLLQHAEDMRGASHTYNSSLSLYNNVPSGCSSLKDLLMVKVYWFFNIVDVGR